MCSFPLHVPLLGVRVPRDTKAIGSMYRDLHVDINTDLDVNLDINIVLHVDLDAGTV